MQQYAASIFLWDFSSVLSLKEIRLFKSLSLGKSNSDACLSRIPKAEIHFWFTTLPLGLCKHSLAPQWVTADKRDECT